MKFSSRSTLHHRHLSGARNVFLVFRTYGSFTMETILATAFGRVIEIQRGESDELTSAVDSIFRGVQEGKSMSATFVMSVLSEMIL